MSEYKAVNYSFSGSKLSVTVDPNKDGESLIKVEIDMAEIPDEVLSLINARKGA